jgi:hypothetical protein
MTKQNLKRLALLVVAGLPAMEVGAQQADPGMEAGIDLCVQMRERIFECKEQFADFFVARHNPPPEQRDALRRKALEEIVQEGSGPLEPRRKICAAMARPGHAPPSKEWLDEARKKLEGCAATTDCSARVACMKNILKPGKLAK